MKYNFYLLTLFILIMVSSCAPRLYFPDRVQTTSFTGKNQAVINGSVKPQVAHTERNGVDSFRSKSASFSFDAAYSFDDHWGITGYYSNLLDRSTSENWWGNSGGIYNGHRYEIGGVYFKSFPSKAIFEVGAGFSRGNINRTNAFSTTDNFKADYNIYYGQVAYGFKWDFVGLTIGNRTWLQHYNRFQTNSAFIRDAFRSESSPYRDITQYPFLFTNFFYNFEFVQIHQVQYTVGYANTINGTQKCRFPCLYDIWFGIPPGAGNIQRKSFQK